MGDERINTHAKKDHGFEIGLFTTERQSFNSYVLSLQWWLNYKGVLQANGI
jgi:hypothetical protein